MLCFSLSFIVRGVHQDSHFFCFTLHIFVLSIILPQILVVYVHMEWGLDVFIYEGFMTQSVIFI